MGVGGYCGKRMQHNQVLRPLGSMEADNTEKIKDPCCAKEGVEFVLGQADYL